MQHSLSEDNLFSLAYARNVKIRWRRHVHTELLPHKLIDLLNASIITLHKSFEYNLRAVVVYHSVIYWHRISSEAVIPSWSRKKLIWNLNFQESWIIINDDVVRKPSIHFKWSLLVLANSTLHIIAVLIVYCVYKMLSNPAIHTTHYNIGYRLGCFTSH